MPRYPTPAPFVVAGSGPFPVDMLRRDACHPVDAASVAAITLDTRDLPARETRRAVRLATMREDGPTLGAWSSAGWRVISHDASGYLLDDDEVEQAIQRATGRQALPA